MLSIKKLGIVSGLCLSFVLPFSTASASEEEPETHQMVVTAVVPSTCVQYGYIEETCTTCGEQEYTFETTLAEHSYIFSYWEQNPTCVTDGVGVYECVVCGSVKTETVPADELYHSFLPGEITVEPSCEYYGLREMICSVCGKVDNEHVPMIDHQIPNWEVTLEPTCKNEGRKEGICDLCGNTFEEDIPMIDHKYETLDVIKDATCVSDGIELVACVNCGVEKEITKKDYGHKFNSWYVAKEATDHSMGSKSRTCKNCGYTEGSDFYPDGTIVVGTKKDISVYVLQELLTEENLMQDKVDGIYGKNTERAVKDFQRKENFEESGIAYPQTINRLMENLMDRMTGTKQDLNNGISVEAKAAENKTTLTFTKDGKTYDWTVNKAFASESNAAPATADTQDNSGSAGEAKNRLVLS